VERIDWVIANCRLLAAIGAEFDRTQPFAGLTIGTGIHLEPKTVALLLTLQRGGAEVVATGNLNTTQQSAIDYLTMRGVRVIGAPTSDPAEQDRYLRELVHTRPQLLLDNGGDLFVRYLDEPYDGLLGGTEETTSGRARLEPLRERIGLPVLVINDSPIKQFAENRHAVGQSVLESFIRLTNKSTNGKRVTVFGYGACGQGVAATFRNAYAVVSVVESDPILRLEAMLDGFLVPERDDALRSADVVITVTGAEGVVTAADLPLLRTERSSRTPVTSRARSTRPASKPQPGTASRCSPAATWSTSPARARSATRSSRWTSASRCSHAVSKPWRPAPSAPRRASSRCRARSTKTSPAPSLGGRP
jgi:adenosylhomocysteinase